MCRERVSRGFHSRGYVLVSGAWLVHGCVAVVVAVIYSDDSELDFEQRVEVIEWML